MLTTSFISLRRFAGSVLTVVLSSFVVCANVAAQTPLVVSSSNVAMPHPSGWSQIWNSAINSKGDFVVLDWVNYGVYEFPVNGGPVITVAAPGQLVPGSSGSYWDMGIGIDMNDRVFTGANYGQEGLFSAPYDPVTGTWDLSTYMETAEDAANQSYFQSAAITALPNSTTLVIGDEDGTTGIFTVTYDPVTLKFGVPQYVIKGIKKRARSIAVDSVGNIYFYEDGGAAGVLRIPAGTTGLSDESSLLRVDPNLGSIQGVTVDTAGNLYIADQSAGLFQIPNESGTPNPGHAVLLTPAQAQGTPSVDQARGILYIPTSAWNGFKDVVKTYLNRIELGAATAGSTSATPGTIYYSFSGSVTPHSFVIEEAGAGSDFAVAAGGTCVADTSYTPSTPCTVEVNFTPHSAGDISASLAMLDATGNVLTTTILHGVGQGPAIVMVPATESAIGSALKTPSQVAADASGNVYVADSGLGSVLQYPRGSGAATTPVSIGTGLIAPTGVAVDGAGDVFIGDSGKVIEVPYGPTGLNAAAQFTLKSGLGTRLSIVVDQIGDVFVLDPDNLRVVKLRSLVNSVAETDITGFTQPSAIAANGSGDLFVADGTNLVEISSLGARTTVLTLFSGTRGLAVDPSGAVYIASQATTIRVPNESGTLNPADTITIAAGVANPTSVAVDSVGNVYVIDGNAETVDFVNANGSLSLGTLTTTTGTQTATATIVNDGVAPLNITGFSSTADFSETTTTCIGASIAVGATCTATVTFNPGPGDQGKLSGLILVNSDAANAPIGINVTGVGAALTASTTTVTVTKPTVTNAPVVVTVAPALGTTPVPTGSATLTVTGSGITPVVLTQPLANGTVTFNPSAIKTGAYTFTVVYGGDRVYGTSTASTTATVAAGVVTLIQPAPSKVPTYVLVEGQGAQEPTDGSQIPFYYKYPVVVTAANGAPLMGVPIFGATGKQTGMDYGTVTYVLANGAPACSGSSAVVNVSFDGTAPLGTQCFPIDTSNNQIPNLMTSYTVTPVYSGNTDTNYGTVTGTPITFIALRNSMVIITSNPSSLNVTAGSAATATLTLTSLLGYGIAGANKPQNVNNYSLPLELECDSLPAHASCTFTYPIPDPSDAQSVAVNPTTPGQVILTINTNVPVGTTAANLQSSPVVFAATFGLSLLGLAFGSKKRLPGLLLSGVCLLFIGMVAGLSGCSTASIGTAPVLTTPKGTYNVKVTAKQVGTQVVLGTTGLPEVVQGNGNQMSIPFTVSVVVQ